LTYFEDQEDEWFENECKGEIENYGEGLPYIEPPIKNPNKEEN